MWAGPWCGGGWMGWGPGGGLGGGGGGGRRPNFLIFRSAI